MTAQPAQTYSLPDFHAEATDAVAALQAAQERVARVMAVVTAAAVVDILTNWDREAPFDAAHLELIESADGSLHASGTYWTTTGDEKTFAGELDDHTAYWARHEMNEWVEYLDGENRHVWEPLVQEAGTLGGRKVFRFDLAKAAALPIGPAPIAQA
ncbi:MULTISPECIES: hypothetical protein [unclassified Streptomyces]|uniref:hypothetical protein n=1 Tax=unclassified Streptomyces TaxID=2593676 RepID=UPI0033A2C7FC